MSWGKFGKDLVFGFFFAVVASIIFVSAGSRGKNGQSGGAQSAEIIGAGSSGISGIAKALEQA